MKEGESALRHLTQTWEARGKVLRGGVIVEN